MYDSDVLVEVEDWVLDLGTPRDHHNQYLHTLDLHWHIKNLLRKVLFDCTETRDEILLDMEELHLLYQFMYDRM